jgi:hypothetical protein
MTTAQYLRLDQGPIDEIDAALFNGDMFFNRENIQALREQLARWERQIAVCEQIANEIEQGDQR